MRQHGNGMRELRWRLNYDMEIFLRMAAYRATHAGGNPPPNSQLWMEHARIWEENHRPGRLARLLGRRGGREPEWRDAPPLERFPVVKPFLRDDYTVEQVAARLESWPMITASRMADRDPLGEWFLFVIEVLADSKRKAEYIVDCIFMLEPQVPSNPEIN
jgi:hypothetical protein